jgi:hypothetical protein
MAAFSNWHAQKRLSACTWMIGCVCACFVVGWQEHIFSTAHLMQTTVLSSLNFACCACCVFSAATETQDAVLHSPTVLCDIPLLTFYSPLLLLPLLPLLMQVCRCRPTRRR